MEELRLQQISGEALPMAKGNGQDAKGYKIPAHERHLVHARIWVPSFNPQTGEDQAARTVQTYDPKDFERMKNEQAFAGMKVEILHDGGDAEVEGVDPEDALTPQVVSQPGAGLDLTRDYSKESAASLKEVYKQFFPTEQNVPTKKEDLLEASTSRVGFLKDEAQRQELESIEQNRLAAAGVDGNKSTEGAK